MQHWVVVSYSCVSIVGQPISPTYKGQKQPKANYQSTMHNIPQEEIPVLTYFQISLMDHLQFLFARMPTPMEEASE